MLEISPAPGQALKSPARMRCSEKPDAHAFSSFICVVRRELESASRCVEKTLTRMPLTRIWMRATARE